MRTAAAILLCIILPSQVNALKALATCLSGNELVCSSFHFPDYDLNSFCQMFSSTGQSPCDVAVELASVCYSASECASFSMFGSNELSKIQHIKYPHSALPVENYMIKGLARAVIPAACATQSTTRC